jgi:hypothetical protein
MTRRDTLHAMPHCDRLSRHFNNMPTGTNVPDRRSRPPPPPPPVLRRLLPRYERYIGGRPPVAGLGLECAMAALRRDLAAAGAHADGRPDPATGH